MALPFCFWCQKRARPVNSTMSEVQPGTYTVKDTPVSDCHGERGESQGNIIDNNFVNLHRK